MKPILIDDVFQTASWLSPSGHLITDEIISSFHHELSAHIRKKGWTIIDYQEFIDWVQLNHNIEATWIILDKIFPIASVPGNGIRINAHRSLRRPTQKNMESELNYEFQGESKYFQHNQPIILLDDAAYTGTTLTKTMDIFLKKAADNIILFVARKSVADKNRKNGINFSYKYEAAIGQDILHFRDFFPWLPFSGRRLNNQYLSLTSGEILPFHVAHALHNHGRWLQIENDTQIQKVLVSMNQEFIKSFDRFLHRASIVADLPLLSENISIPLDSFDQYVDTIVKLQSLLLAT